MGKIPYLFRRNNVFYFRIRVPLEHQGTLNAREIVQSLRTENQLEAIPQALKLAASFKAILRDLKTGKKQTLCRSEVITREGVTFEPLAPSPAVIAEASTPDTIVKSNTPLLSVVIDDFLKRYDPSAKVMLGKLSATLPILVELIDNKPINQILQADLNHFFDDVQKLPVRRDTSQFKGLSFREVIEANRGPCIAEKTFKSTYRACLSVFLNWAATHYKDQGFPCLSVDGADYRGESADGTHIHQTYKRAT